MKKILIFSLAYVPYLGGAEIAIKEITDRISINDYVFDMITPRYDSNLPKFEQIGNITVHRVGFSIDSPSPSDMVGFFLYFTKVFYPFYALIKALSLQKKESFNVLWSMMSYAGFPAVLFGMFYSKIPLALTLQEGDTIEHITKRLRIKIVSPLYKRIYKKAKITQVISNYLGEFAFRMGAKNIQVVPNGINFEKFSTPAPAEVLDSLNQQLKTDPSERFIITTSRLVHKNGVDIIISALKDLPEHIILLVLGDGPLLKKLTNLANSEGVANRVRFLGHINQIDIPAYLQISEVFVRPSRSEGMGISFLEAMAVGIPVVATPVGGISDFLVDYINGLFCKAEDSKNCATAISILLNDIALRDKIVTNAKNMVRDKYDWTNIANVMKTNIFDALFSQDNKIHEPLIEKNKYSTEEI